MLEITIQNENNYIVLNETSGCTGFTIIFDDNQTEATYFEKTGFSDSSSSKLIQAEPFLSSIEQLRQTDYFKLIDENNSLHFLDGSSSSVTLSVNSSSLKIELWSPELSFYKKAECTECVKFLKTINRIISEVQKTGAAQDFSFC